MAGDEGPEPVPGAERAGCTRSAGAASERGELAVGDHLAARKPPQHPRAVAVEAVVQVELDIGEVVRLAREEGRQPSRQDMSRGLTLGHACNRPGQLGPEDAGAVEPDLADPEGRRLVLHQRRLHP